MANPSWMDRSGATPKKLALVGVLGVVLVIVIWRQVFGSHEAEVAVRPPTRSATSQKSASASSKGVPDKAAPKETLEAVPHAAFAHEWPELPLADVLVNDPFQPPEWYLVADQPDGERPSPAFVENREKLLDQLRQKPTNIVVISGNSKVATIDGNEIRVGDLIDGFRVTDITTEGITLSEMKTR